MSFDFKFHPIEPEIIRCHAKHISIVYTEKSGVANIFQLHNRFPPHDTLPQTAVAVIDYRIKFSASTFRRIRADNKVSPLPALAPRAALTRSHFLLMPKTEREG